MKVALAQINPIVGALSYNCSLILEAIQSAKKQGSELLLFPELALCGYPPEDLLLLPSFIKAIEKEIVPIVEASVGMAVIVGCVRPNRTAGEKGLFNSAAVMEDGKLVGFYDKRLLPEYDVFSERRYFDPGNGANIFTLLGKKVGISICEDIWQHGQFNTEIRYLLDPVLDLQTQKPHLVVNLSSSPFYTERHDMRVKVCAAVAKTTQSPVFLCNQVGGNDSLIFDGHSLALSSKGDLIACCKGFEPDLVVIDTKKPISIKIASNPIKELFSALVLGVRDYFYKLGFKKACFGLSGGIDSAVVAVIATSALGAENILALMMPSRYSLDASMEDAILIARSLNIKTKTLSIELPFEAFLTTLAPHFLDKQPDVTEENLQARIRGMLLMAFSNKLGHLVLSTGNKSELAMGYTTLYGDSCGGLAVLNDVTKEQVYQLAGYINQEAMVIPKRVMERPPSAELRKGQTDQDSLPSYSVVDAVLQSYIEDHLSPEKIAQKHHLDLALVNSLICKIHQNEYKRRQTPPGLRVTKKAFSIGRRFPIVHHWR